MGRSGHQADAVSFEWKKKPAEWENVLQTQMTK